MLQLLIRCCSHHSRGCTALQQAPVLAWHHSSTRGDKHWSVQPPSNQEHSSRGGPADDGSSSSSTCKSSSAAIDTIKSLLSQPQQQQQQQQAHPHERKRHQSPAGRPSQQSSFLSGADIKQARSITSLSQLVQEHAGSMTGIAVSAAYTRLGKLCQQDAALATTAAARELLQLLDQLLPSVQQQMDARGLSNIIWACAHAQHQSPASRQLLPLFLDGRMLSAANAFDISNVVWAVATTGGVLDRTQLKHVLSRYIKQLLDAVPQGIANTLWGVAEMGQQVPAGQLQQMLDALTSQLCTAKPQHISSTLWAVAEMGQQVPQQQLQQMLEALASQLQMADPQAISNSLWACARFRQAPTQLLVALEQQEQQRQRLLSASNPQALANMANACAQLGYKGQLPGAVLDQAVRLLSPGGGTTFSCQELCNLCWSAAVLNMTEHTQAVLQLAQACKQTWSSNATKDMQQLHQVHLWLFDRQLPAGGQGLLGVLTGQQLEQCRISWEQQLMEDAVVAKASQTQLAVFNSLQQLPGSTWQQPPVMEQRTADGAFSIDIAAVTAAGVRVAIEVDGPTHFISPDNSVDGPTQLRNRSLAARGYTVIHIPYWEWHALQSPAEQQAYLLGKL